MSGTCWFCSTWHSHSKFHKLVVIEPAINVRVPSLVCKNTSSNLSASARRSTRLSFCKLCIIQRSTCSFPGICSRAFSFIRTRRASGYTNTADEFDTACSFEDQKKTETIEKLFALFARIRKHSPKYTSSFYRFSIPALLISICPPAPVFPLRSFVIPPSPTLIVIVLARDVHVQKRFIRLVCSQFFKTWKKGSEKLRENLSTSRIQSFLLPEWFRNKEKQNVALLSVENRKC